MVFLKRYKLLVFLTKMVFLKRYKVFRRKTCVPSFSTGQVPKTCVPSFSLGQVPKTCVLTKTTFLKGHQFSSGKPSFSPLFFEKGQGRDTRLENLCPYLSRRKGAVFLRKTFLVSLPCPFSGKRGEKVPKTGVPSKIIFLSGKGAENWFHPFSQKRKGYIRKGIDTKKSGNSSMVEYCVANAKVEGSNPFFRFIL